MNNFITELKRRNIFRVAGVYAVVGWLLIQLGIALETSLDMPGWFDKLITILVIVGFPLALVLAWAFEMTPDGVKRTESVDAENSIVDKTGRKLDFAIVSGLVAIIALAGFQLTRSTAPADNTAAIEPPVSVDTKIETLSKSIAVLPFVNMSSDVDQEYFADGITEEILNALVKASKLRVAGRTSSFSFKNTDKNIKEIGEILSVSHVLEGSVRKQNNEVRITAQLIKADDGFHLWSETYDGSLENIFDLQEDISRKVTDELKVLLELEPGARLASKMTTNIDAYDLFLRGRQLVAKRLDNNIPDGIALLKQAVELDPQFGEAWAVLAEAEAVSPGYLPIDQGAANKRARAHIKTALALDADLVLPHAIEGLILGDEFDYAGSIEALTKALTLEPNNPLTQRWLGGRYSQLGLFEKALPLWERAYALDPFSAADSFNLGIVYFAVGELEQAKKYFKISDNLRSVSAGIFGFVLDSLGDHEGARAFYMSTYDDDVERFPSDTYITREQAEIYARGAFGGTEKERQAARELPRSIRGRPDDSAYWQLKYHIVTGNFDRVFEILENKPSFFGVFSADHIWAQHKDFKAFRSDPRFVKLLQRNKIPEAWQVLGWPKYCKPNPGTDGSKGQFSCE